jgi:hypothetical protein
MPKFGKNPAIDRLFGDIDRAEAARKPPEKEDEGAAKPPPPTNREKLAKLNKQKGLPEFDGTEAQAGRILAARAGRKHDLALIDKDNDRKRLDDFAGGTADARGIVAARRVRGAGIARRLEDKKVLAELNIQNDDRGLPEFKGPAAAARRILGARAAAQAGGAGGNAAAAAGVAPPEKPKFKAEFHGLEDFAHTLQINALGGKDGKDFAKDTAEGVKTMTETLKDMQAQGIKIQGGIGGGVAVAG